MKLVWVSVIVVCLVVIVSNSICNSKCLVVVYVSLFKIQIFNKNFLISRKIIINSAFLLV